MNYSYRQGQKTSIILIERKNLYQREMRNKKRQLFFKAEKKFYKGEQPQNVHFFDKRQKRL